MVRIGNSNEQLEPKTIRQAVDTTLSIVIFKKAVSYIDLYGESETGFEKVPVYYCILYVPSVDQITIAPMVTQYELSGCLGQRVDLSDYYWPEAAEPTLNIGEVIIKSPIIEKFDIKNSYYKRRIDNIVFDIKQKIAKILAEKEIMDWSELKVSLQEEYNLKTSL